MRSHLAVGHGRLSNEPLAGAGIEYPLEVIAWVIPGLVPLSPLITAWTYQHATIGGSAAPFRARAWGGLRSGRYDALMEPWGLSRARPSTAVQCAPLRSARKEARDEADRVACEASNQRMLGYQDPAQPSPAIGNALNARYLYLEGRCFGRDTHQTVTLNIVRRPKASPCSSRRAADV
jgi:hypothetical protein